MVTNQNNPIRLLFSMNSSNDVINLLFGDLIMGYYTDGCIGCSKAWTKSVSQVKSSPPNVWYFTTWKWYWWRYLLFTMPGQRYILDFICKSYHSFCLTAPEHPRTIWAAQEYQEFPCGSQVSCTYQRQTGGLVSRDLQTLISLVSRKQRYVSSIVYWGMSLRLIGQLYYGRKDLGRIIHLLLLFWLPLIPAQFI